jgi:hypothetical protein
LETAHIDIRLLRHGHTLVELMAALIACALLLAGLGSVMLVARQIAYTPSAATHRLEAAKIVDELSDELRWATFITERSDKLVAFVVADRNGDGTEERIRYEWSGTPGDPLLRSYNGGAPVAVLDSVQDFLLEYATRDVTTPIKTTTDGTEVMLQGNTTVQTSNYRDITSSNWSAQQIDPAAFVSAAPSNALYWNATRAEFQGASSGPATSTLFVQLSSTGTPYNSPTSHRLVQTSIPESSLGTGFGWITAQFATPARNLALHRKYALVWATADGSSAGKLRSDTSATSGVLESGDGGASWQYMSPKQIYYRLYGTYTTPGPTYDITRNYLSQVSVRLQTSTQAHSRVDASISLANSPELLSAYWHTDFDSDPTASDVNGDGTPDWQGVAAVEVLGAPTYDPDTASGGLWYASGKLQTQPMNNFSSTTAVEVRFRSTSAAGGNGAVVKINADWGSGLHAPLFAKVQMQPDGTQTFSLLGRSNDTTDVVLMQEPNLDGEFVRCRLTILPEHDLVNVCVNDEDLGTFTYPTFASSASDRLMSVYGDTTSAQFDYVEARVSEAD